MVKTTITEVVKLIQYNTGQCNHNPWAYFNYRLLLMQVILLMVKTTITEVVKLIQYNTGQCNHNPWAYFNYRLLLMQVLLLRLLLPIFYNG